MKNHASLLLFVALLNETFAQNCPPPTAYYDLHANTVEARILDGGFLFTEENHGHFLPNPVPGMQTPTTMYAAGLWMGGLDLAGNLKLSVADYNGSAYRAGPLDSLTGQITQEDCAHWDRIFHVTDGQIAGFLADLPGFTDNPGAAISQYPEIMGWPATGNPYFSLVFDFDLPKMPHDLAPFQDTDGDGQYDPLKGDFPALPDILPGKIPAELSWCVFNDQANDKPFFLHPIQAEVQLTAWALDCPGVEVLNRTVFTEHKIIYRGKESLDSVQFALWADFDIGCMTNDYIGSAPDLQAFYGYNKDTADVFCSPFGEEPFPGIPPVQSVLLLNRSLDRFMCFYNPSYGNPLPSTADPAEPIEDFRYLTGHWRDGLPLTVGGNGYNTAGGIPATHAFPGDPADSGAWTMCSAPPLANRDPRGLGICQIGLLQPGQVEKIVAAWTVHPNPNLPCGLGSTFSDIVALKDLYDTHFNGVCSLVNGATEPAPGDVAMNVYPNPAGQQVTLSYGRLALQEIRLLDMNGRIVRRLHNPPGEQCQFSVNDLAPGLYGIQGIGKRYTLARQVFICR